MEEIELKWHECMTNWNFFKIHREIFEQADPEIRDGLMACLLGKEMFRIE